MDVSVVIGVYNGAADLRATLDSVLTQDIDSETFEVVVVNDGSTDETASILNEYAAKDERVRVYHSENKGLTQALIWGCQQARGLFIMRQDVGDISLPQRMRLQREALLAEPRLAFVSCWTQWVGPEMEALYIETGGGKSDASKPLDIRGTVEDPWLKAGPSCHASVMFRKDAYERSGGYRKEFYFCQDHDLWHRLSLEGLFQTIPEVLYQFRLMPGSISASKRSVQQVYGKYSHEVYALRLKQESDDALMKEVANIRHHKASSVGSQTLMDAHWYYFISKLLNANRNPRSIHYLKKALSIRFSLKYGIVFVWYLACSLWYRL